MQSSEEENSKEECEGDDDDKAEGEKEIVQNFSQNKAPNQIKRNYRQDEHSPNESSKKVLIFVTTLEESHIC